MTQAGTSAAAALKYQAKHGTCADQPCAQTPKFLAKARPGAFRFIKVAAACDDDFVPLPLTPRGMNSGGNRPLTCEHWALSFFSSQASILRKWFSLLERLDLDAAKDRYGSHIAEIDLAANDGVSDEPGMNGHISLHQYEPHDPFPPRVKASTPLPAAPAVTAARALAPTTTPTPPLSGQRVIKLAPKLAPKKPGT